MNISRPRSLTFPFTPPRDEAVEDLLQLLATRSPPRPLPQELMAARQEALAAKLRACIQNQPRLPPRPLLSQSRTFFSSRRRLAAVATALGLSMLALGAALVTEALRLEANARASWIKTENRPPAPPLAAASPTPNSAPRAASDAPPSVHSSAELVLPAPFNAAFRPRDYASFTPRDTGPAVIAQVSRAPAEDDLTPGAGRAGASDGREPQITDKNPSLTQEAPSPAKAAHHRGSGKARPRAPGQKENLAHQPAAPASVLANGAKPGN